MKNTGQMLRTCASLSLLILPLGVLAENVDCRSCHGVTSSAGVVDLNAIYADPAKHHPVDIGFPAVLDSYRMPPAQSGEISFFDRNGNGMPDADEIQLFGQGPSAQMTCSTCHAEHGTTHALQQKLPMYLRVTNTGNGLCSTCHVQ